MTSTTRTVYPFTLAQVKEIISYDPATGIFRWVKGKPTAHGQYVQSAAGEEAGFIVQQISGKQYWALKVFGIRIKAHRLAMFMETGAWPADLVDHVNNDGLDNRFCNLRHANKSQNAQNKKMRCDNTSGVVGVSRKAGRWVAQIKLNQKNYCLGLFDSIEEAAEARWKAERRMFGEFSPRVAKKLADAMK